MLGTFQLFPGVYPHNHIFFKYYVMKDYDQDFLYVLMLEMLLWFTNNPIKIVIMNEKEDIYIFSFLGIHVSEAEKNIFIQLSKIYSGAHQRMKKGNFLCNSRNCKSWLCIS